MQHSGDTAAPSPSFVTASGIVFDRRKKMETRHKQTSNISILQVNHLHWPQCATAQRDERKEEPLKLGVIRQMKGHLKIISSQVNRRPARGLRRGCWNAEVCFPSPVLIFSP